MKTMYASVITDGDTFIFEDAKTGIVFTTKGSLPDSDEVEHVEAYHAGRFCPLWGSNIGITACETNIRNGTVGPACHDRGLAGKW